MRDTTRHSPTRRTFLKTTGGFVGTGLVAGCIGGGSDDGQPQGNDTDQDDPEFPEKDIQLVIPYGPGGGYDAYTRLVAPYVEKYLPGDIEVHVQNVEGAGGIVATEKVYNADPDGYTNMIINAHDFTLTQQTEEVDFDIRDMTYYAQTAQDVWEIGVGTNTGIESWDEYVDAVQNEELHFYHSGGVSLNILTPMVIGEFSDLYSASNVVDNIVTYDGRSEGIKGILGGELEAMGGSRSAMAPYTDSGDIRTIMLATLDDEPPEEIPDAETLTSADVPNREAIASALPHGRMYAGPPNAPEERANILRDAFEQAINDEDFLAEAAEAEREITYADAETAQQRVVDMYDEWHEYRELLELLT